MKGFAKFFKDFAEEEHGHAEKLIKYQNLRGGRVTFNDIGRPVEQEWTTPLAAIEFALNLEKKVNQVIVLKNSELVEKKQSLLLCFYLAGIVGSTQKC